jgi:hypothetical protein
MCGSAIMHEVQFSTNEQWHIGEEIRYAVFHEIYCNSDLYVCLEVHGIRINYHHKYRLALDLSTLSRQLYVCNTILFCISESYFVSICIFDLFYIPWLVKPSRINGMK